MSSGLFGIGISGLSAAQAGLVTTGHNIANASTPGFHRQQVLQSASPPLVTGGGVVGQGVTVDTVTRVYSAFLDANAANAQARASYYATYSGQVGQVDSLLGDASVGLGPQLQAFFAAVHDATADPASVPSRQGMLSAADSLISRFQSLDSRFNEIRASINGQVESAVASVNVYAREIAALNGRITATGGSADQIPNDLFDKRDQLVSELNSLIGATVVTNPGGTIAVSIGTGQPLVIGSQAYSLGTTASPEVAGETDIVYKSGSASIAMTPSMLTAGSVGALLAFRAGALANTQNQLGRIAAGLGETFNAQHRLGQDLSGALGTNFFSTSQPVVMGHPANTGTATLSATIASTTALTASDYRVAYSGGAYQVTRLSDNTTTSSPTLPLILDGLNIQLGSGTPANGDTFLIQPTRFAAGNLAVAIVDTSRIALAAPMRTSSALANTGSGKIDAGAVTPPGDPNVQQPVGIVFTSATTFDVTGTGTGNPTGMVYSPGTPITYNGWTVKITGAPRAGDQFNVTSNTNGAADNRNAQALANLQVSNTINGGTATYQDAYGQLTSSVGNAAREMKIAADVGEAMALRSREAQQAVSGVNLDEEAANLIRYQQAYQASSKVIEVASTLFDTILRIGA